MELKPLEIVGNLTQRAYNVGRFVMEHVRSGAWGDLAESIKPVKTPVEHGIGEE